jgi:hypothetical protein
MKKSIEPKYKVLSNFPEQTLTQWYKDYCGFVNTFYSTPVSKRNGAMWNDFINSINEVKKFLKKNKIKFI